MTLPCRLASIAFLQPSALADMAMRPAYLCFHSFDCNMGGTAWMMCGITILPPSAQASRSNAASAATQFSWGRELVSKRRENSNKVKHSHHKHAPTADYQYYYLIFLFQWKELTSLSTSSTSSSSAQSSSSSRSVIICNICTTRGGMYLS